MSPERRSLLVTGIAFQGAALSAIGTVVGTLLTIMLYLFFPLDQMRQSAEAAAKASPLVPSFARVLPIYLPAFFFTLTLCSALSLVVSIGLMKRKPWARWAFIILLGLAILLNMFILCSMEYSFLAQGEIKSPIAGLNTLRYGLALAIFIITVGFSLFFAFLMKSLSTSEVCQEFNEKDSSS